MNFVPTSVFLTRGWPAQVPAEVVRGALRHAGVQLNLVQVSSILPPKCKIVSREAV